MNEFTKNERNLLLDQKSKIVSIKALAHFVPNRIRYHSQRGQSLDLKSIKQFCSSPKTKNQSKGSQRYGRSKITKNVSHSNSNQDMILKQNKYSYRLNRSAIVSSNPTQFMKQRKRLNEFVSIISREKKKINEREIERTTEMIQSQMERQKYERYFEHMEQQFLKKQYQLVNRKSFYQKIWAFSKEHLRQQEQVQKQAEQSNQNNLSRMIRQTKRNFFQISNLKSRQIVKHQQK